MNMSTRGRVAFTPPLFRDEDFHLKVLREGVSLETVVISTDSITGHIRVANLSDAKTVAVRYTTDKWESYSEVEAEWSESVEDGEMDRFVFTLPAPKEVGELSFAVRYNDRWDNNGKSNYTVLFERV